MSDQEHLRAVAGYALDRRLRRVEAQAILAAADRLEAADRRIAVLVEQLKASDHAHRNTKQRLLLLEAAQVDETVAHGLRSPVSGALVPVPDPSRMGARRGFVLSRRCESADGIQQVYRFPNGYGASVVRGRVFGLENASKWRMAITLWEGEDFRVLDEVIGFLADSEVEVCLSKVEEMATGAYPYDLANESAAPWALVPGSVQTERRCGDCGRVYVAGSPGWRKVGGIDSCPECRAKSPAGWLAKAADGIVADMDAGGAS